MKKIGKLGILEKILKGDITYTTKNLWIFEKKHWDGELAPHATWDFISMILCNKNPITVLLIKRCVGGRRCRECGDLTLFHRKFPIDPTHPGLSDITVKWKRFEDVSMNPSSSLHVPSKRINLLEDEIPISDFMDLQIHQTLPQV